MHDYMSHDFSIASENNCSVAINLAINRILFDVGEINEAIFLAVSRFSLYRLHAVEARLSPTLNEFRIQRYIFILEQRFFSRRKRCPRTIRDFATRRGLFSPIFPAAIRYIALLKIVPCTCARLRENLARKS